MAFARDTYTATAAQVDFTITFPYVEEADVQVYQNGTLLTSTTDYTFFNSTTIRLVSGATEDDVILLLRSTSQSTRTVDFTPGTLTEADLDNSAIQLFYMAQEAFDEANTALGLGSNDQWDATSKRINNVTDPTAAQDAATKAYIDAIQVSTGNVPTPDNPGEDDNVLIASGGTFDWGAVDTANLAADAVTTAKILDANVTTAKIADNAVTVAKIAPGTAGQHLGSDGTDPVWISGVEEFVEYADLTAGGADNLAEYEFTHDMEDGFKYIVRIRGLSSDTGSFYPKMRLRNDGGTLLSGSTDYYVSAIHPTATGLASTSAASISLYTHSGFGGLFADTPVNSTVLIEGAMDTAVRTAVGGLTVVHDSAVSVALTFAASVEAIDGHQNIVLVNSGGNFNGGEAWLSRIKEGS